MVAMHISYRANVPPYMRARYASQSCTRHGLRGSDAVADTAVTRLASMYESGLGAGWGEKAELGELLYL